MNMKINNERYSTAVMALLLLLVAAVLACSSGDEADKANKLVDEGNAAVQEGNKNATEAEAKRQKMFQAGWAQLDEARATAKEVITACDKAKDNYKEASRKYDEASKLKVKDKFREYLTLKVKELDKRAELFETAKGTPQALIDSESRANYISMATANNESIDRLSKEVKDLEAQADKLRKDNPDQFKKD